MGNILFHLQFPAPELPKQIIYDTFFDTLDWGDKSAFGSGTVTLDLDKIAISSQGVTGSGGYILKRLAYPRAPLTWSNPRSFKLRARVDVGSDANSEIYICTGNQAANRRAFGFRFTNNKVRGFAKNAGAENYVDLVTGLSPPYSRNEVYEAKLTPGSKIEFYINDVLKGTLNTGIPTGTTDAERLLMIFLLSAANVYHWIYTSMFRVIQDE